MRGMYGPYRGLYLQSHRCVRYTSQKAKYGLQIAGSCNLNLQVDSTQDNDEQKKCEQCTAFAVPVMWGRGMVRGCYWRLLFSVKLCTSPDPRSEILVLC